MTSTRLTLAAALLACSATLAPAASVERYTGLIVFGDSLSDPGNLFAATGGTAPPSPPYFEGRFSNGPVWSGIVAARFQASGQPTANFAFGLANAIPDGDGIPDLPQQLGLASTIPLQALGDRPLASLWFGANDLFGALDGGADALTINTVAVAAAKAVAAGVTALATSGISDFLVFNLPDLGRIPAYALFQPDRADDASQGTQTFNATLETELAALRGAGLRITDIDIAGLFEELLTDPQQYGLANVTTPCVIGFIPVCTPEQLAASAFFDPVHPTAAVHAAIADEVDEVAAPVPLPASGLLLAGALAVVAIRRLKAA